MKNVLLRARILSVSTISACTFFGASALLFSQSRDFNAERFILDDNAGDGTRNTLLLQVPVTGLSANRTLTLPDADGTVVIAGPGGLTANQILFGGPAGQVAQSANLLWDNTTSIFSIGGGLFTIDGTSGNTVIVGTLDQQGAVSNSTGDVVVNDDANVTGSLDVDTDLNVDGITTLVGAVDAQAAGNVMGDGTDAEQLEVQGVDGGAVEVDVNGDMDVSGTLTVGTLTLTGDLDMDQNDIVDLGNIEFSTVGSNLSNTAGDVTINDNVVVTGTSDLQGAVSNSTGDVVIGDDANVTGSLDVDTDLNVDGNTVHVGTLDQQGAISSSTGNVTISDDVDVTGNIVPTADNTYALGSNTNRFSELFVAGPTIHIGSSADEAEISFDGASGLEFDGNDDGTADLTIDGTTGDISVAGDMDIAGTLTFPVTAAQGDALIAAINGGTTTIDAARIGSGLTDAQVNDNLTIDGGSVDATPVGATTPSTGAFTTLTGTALPAASTSTDLVTSNGGALETRTLASLAGEIGVSTDATLTGDGTTGDPLGLDLTNANTWTGTQTLPTTAAQGDALIASTNAGTTTVDAARIGSGLTDAQVNDNLTIDGGTVDATPVGATTPSTGAFTTLTGTALPAASTSTDLVTSNGGALETRTLASLAGEIGVSTDATLTGDGTTGSPLGLDLTNANTWTGTQTLPTTAAQGDALIASTNAGTTTVDAARIGAGLTDAQVNDNLTIDGGTVDATPVGATTPSTGAFTTLTGTTITGTALPGASTSTDIVTSNGGALETRTLASLAGEIGVSTDATLTGDGTTGDPLGLDLTNANTWTGTQTLPTTAAQGDALIASTNAGTTTVDAARIGAGLTDAQVNDNLTIDGGTVDATPVGATTPSTGAFTTLTGTALPAASTSTDIVTSNGGALETRTLASLAGEIGVSTDATLTGDGTTGSPLGLDLTNANTWTGTQTLSTTAAQGDALIASTNSGTTTIDAARIGAGLTDAQVNDNLTIDGGTVDATPIGATTPSTGAFTTLTGTTITGTALPGASTSTDIVTSNGGALETRTLASLAGEIGVSTDATLTGDGTTGSPLGLDLTNANTWTGTQTLPTTAAQGDALIASTNSGTTTVDAARIGSGLTDAQVNDNLTIDGGTVDATPVGATTPSTGAFTTLTGTALPAASTSTDLVTSNGGALETRTLASLAGEIGVSTDATLTGDGTTGSPLGLDLTNANTWTGTQTLPTTAAQGDALIASTNSGTTTVDAARIGSGLTDAQVNDNLTIDGGTVDATPVGATTPSTGAFTTLTGTALPAASTSTDIVTSNGGALETRTLASLAGEIGVSTDATLTGDGTTGSPLGFDLTNANTWTGTQTLPTTAAQGDALIASTNAGTTTVDAARIGSGLTDAQVNDNLTIDGGTVDATPVGATTPSTGAFTTLTGTALPAASTSTDLVTSNGGALETRTLASLAGEIGVSTDATLTGDGTGATPLGVNLGNANTWTGTQTLPTTAAQGDALIASTNSGTTTVDAARIGSGLTDAQVNDNLTIDGGTVDATPVGATTPSTGAFTTLTGTTITGTALPGASTSTDIVTSNGGALETRTLASLAGEIGVSTDATLTGDGTTGSPLGLDLTNANTWTGTQTLPATAAQGDALIASTNAGTTTVDAARIGSGLTDAQVNDNLTIDGGTVDATPVGATTPSTGAFTTLTGTALPAASTSTDLVTSNGGALETRTLASLAGEIGVSTDATLTGDGTTGDPLGLDLTNANTWTGTQTLPTTAAQGDALIASTNAGTTTVDAARIGAGLTDAQVNDNLTIDGGTVDATPIGATTPSTGAFTTLTGTALPAASTSTDIVTSNGGALETRTLASLAGEIGVNTDATLTGDGTTGDPLGLDLTNANTWTGTQTLPTTAAQGDALIASTNSGTTTVDAARIGAGLTDAQVNDNLTIDGGTVDATPIGATTPSTGAFTTLTGTTITGTALPGASTSTDIVTSNGGALETRTLASLAGEIGVSTDATLTGDGTTGSPLGLDLTNANTWTGTQTLPTTAAQGDALIASTNAGTTTVDAARIGAGLTDAQVNDNLTINGGSVDATPVGATTPSTGAFTTLTGTALPGASTSTDLVTSNGGALETRTLASLAGEIGVSTDATLTGDGTTGDPLGLDLTNANTWTGTQTLPTTAAQGDALIASTNSGTTTIDAARIGSGLTDAQVNDNLTIDGGTVDATPVGATTPSTGTFTTLTATGISDLQGAISNSTGNVTINDDVDVTGNIVPTADDTYALGSNTNRFSELFVAGPTIHIGSSADEAQITFNPGTGLEIDGDDDGTADLTIDGATGNVGIDGDLIITGTFTSAGFTFSPTEIDMNGGDVIDVDDLQFSQITSDISNTVADVVVNDNLNVTGNSDLDGTLNVDGITTLNGASTIGDGDDNVTLNMGTGDLALAGIDAGAAGDELLTINTGTNVVGRRAFATAVDQGIMHDAANGEFVLGADVSGTNPITTGRFVTVNNQLTFDGSGIVEFQAPTLRLGETGTTALSLGNSATDHTIAGNNVIGTFGSQVALTSEADISLNHSLTGGGITTQATSAVSSSGATMSATYTNAGVSDLSELLLDATTVSAVSYNDDGLGNLTNYFELTADHSAQTVLLTLVDDVNSPGNVIEVSADNPSNTLSMTTTDQTGSASVSIVGTNGSEAVTISAGAGSIAVEPTQTTVTGDLSVPSGNVSITGSATINNAGGVGLEVTSGGVLLSYSSGAPATIPDDVAVFEVDDATGASAPTVALPAGGANGQILYIYVSDPDGATVGGNAQAAGDKLTYIYAGGAWQLFHTN